MAISCKVTDLEYLEMGISLLQSPDDSVRVAVGMEWWVEGKRGLLLAQGLAGPLFAANSPVLLSDSPVMAQLEFASCIK